MENTLVNQQAAPQVRTLVTARESEKRNTEAVKPLGRKEFFADAELSAAWGGNYFKYRTAGNSIGVAYVEKARSAGLVFAGCTESIDKTTGAIKSIGVRFVAPPKSKESDAVEAIRAELNKALAEIAALKGAK